MNDEVLLLTVCHAVPDIAVGRIPCTLHAARRDRGSHEAPALLLVTVQVPLVCVQVMSYRLDRNDAGQQGPLVQAQEWNRPQQAPQGRADNRAEADCQGRDPVRRESGG